MANSTYDSESQFSVVELKARIDKLQIAPPYKVLRVWFDGLVDPEIPDILETPQHRPINLVAQYHKIEKEYIDWSRAVNGSVLEFHLYTWKDEWKHVHDSKEVWELISSVAYEIIPQLKTMNAIGFTVGEYENFPSYALKQENFR